MENFRVVSDKLFRGGSPTPEDIKILHKKYGLQKVVGLDLEAANRINLVCGLLGIENLIFPIDIERKITLVPFLRNIPEIFKLDVPTLIFCARGKDRTGMAVAIYRCVYEGWNHQKAISEAKKLGFGLGLPDKITKLFVKVIKDHCAEKEVEDANEIDDTIVENSHIAGNYDDYYTSPSANLSWSGFGDRNVREFPFSTVELRNYDSPDDTRQNHGLNDLDEHDEWIKNQIQMPQSGQFSDFQSTTMSLGPSGVGGGFV